MRHRPLPLLPALVFLVLVIAAAPAAAQSHFVDANATPGGDGSTWATAFDSLPAAFAASAPGETVWVASGIYYGGFIVPPGVTVLGGFVPGAVARGSRRPWTELTILDGQGTQRVLELGDGCVVDGFRVRNGFAGGHGGGGALIDGTAPTIRNCWFSANRNFAGRGRALRILNGADPLIENTYFVGNTQSPGGHTIDIDASDGVYRHLVLYNNASNGLHFRLDSNPIIRNSIFMQSSGRGICHISLADDPIIENNLFYNNGIALMHVLGVDLGSLGQVNGLSYAQDNIAVNPAFASVGSLDLRLQSGSPCIDAGHAEHPATSTGFFGNARMLDGDLDGSPIPDIGGAEFANLALDLTGPLTPGSTLGVQVTGTAGLLALPAFAPAETPGLFIPPFGDVFLDLGGPLAFLPAGPVPYSLNLTIPAAFPAGTALFFQAVGVSPTGMNLSNLAVLQ